jgi:hypothetical protein
MKYGTKTIMKISRGKRQCKEEKRHKKKVKRTLDGRELQSHTL